jgi:hypothetical protein
MALAVEDDRIVSSRADQRSIGNETECKGPEANGERVSATTTNSSQLSRTPLQMVMITIALMSGTFIVALDVNILGKLDVPLWSLASRSIVFQQPLSPRSLANSIASTMSPGTAPSIPCVRWPFSPLTAAYAASSPSRLSFMSRTACLFSVPSFLP